MARENLFPHEEENLEIALQKLEIPYNELEPIGSICNLADALREISEDSSLQLEDDDDNSNHNKSIESSNGSEFLNSLCTATRGKTCSHCGTRKTPMWREGPMGKKTLCNACGVRYRSGRLFPEYRPASSPDFKPNLHSNFHRKIMEIRKEKNSDTNIAGFEGFQN